MWLAGFGLGAVDPLAAQRPLLGVKRTWPRTCQYVRYSPKADIEAGICTVYPTPDVT